MLRSIQTDFRVPGLGRFVSCVSKISCYLALASRRHLLMLAVVGGARVCTRLLQTREVIQKSSAGILVLSSLVMQIGIYNVVVLDVRLVLCQSVTSVMP